ncbi:hypothetical protein ACFYPA_09080 [Streptomyces sp. NPDC005775]
MEYELSEGEYMDVAFPPVPEGRVGGHVHHSPRVVTFSEPASSPGFTRAWNMRGEEVTT